MAKPKGKSGLLSVAIVFIVSTVIMVYLVWKANLALTIPEGELMLVAKSIAHKQTNDLNTHNFLTERGFLLFPISSFVTSIFSMLLPPSYLLLRLPNIVLYFILLTLLYSSVSRYLLKPTKRYGVYFACILATSPWIINLTTYHPAETLTLIIVLETLIVSNFWQDGKRLSTLQLIIVSSLMIICALTSIEGLIFSLLFLPFFYFTQFKTDGYKSSFKLLTLFTITLVPIVFAMYKNTTYIKTTLTHSTFVETIFPKSLTAEINDRQKIDYLSANKAFLLPALVRKFIYNKPELALNKLTNQVVSIFDFEHFAFPLESYDEVRLSGFIPKGNLPLVYPWDIVLVLVSFGILLKQSKDKSKQLMPKMHEFSRLSGSKSLFTASLQHRAKSPEFSRSLNKILTLLLIGILPAIVFLKRDFYIYGSIAIIPLYIILCSGFASLLNRYQNSPIAGKSIINFIIVLTTVIGIVRFVNTFYFNQHVYKTSDVLFFQDISNWVRTNTSNQNIIITNRFGPTALMTSVYLDVSTTTYWDAYSKSLANPNKSVIQIDNIIFKEFYYPEEPQPSATIFIGLPGEFVNKGTDLEKRSLPQTLQKLGQLTEPDELVWQYGQNLLIMQQQ